MDQFGEILVILKCFSQPFTWGWGVSYCFWCKVLCVNAESCWPGIADHVCITLGVCLCKNILKSPRTWPFKGRWGTKNDIFPCLNYIIAWLCIIYMAFVNEINFWHLRLRNPRWPPPNPRWPPKYLKVSQLNIGDRQLIFKILIWLNLFSILTEGILH